MIIYSYNNQLDQACDKFENPILFQALHVLVSGEVRALAGLGMGKGGRKTLMGKIGRKRLILILTLRKNFMYSYIFYIKCPL